MCNRGKQTKACALTPVTYIHFPIVYGCFPYKSSAGQLKHKLFDLQNQI